MNTDSFFIGMVVAFAGSASSAPKNWLLCDGSQIDQNTYPVLAHLVGIYLPNLCGRVVVGTGSPGINTDGTNTNFPGGTPFSSPYSASGEYEHVLTSDEMPAHSHVLTSYYGWNMSSEDNDGNVPLMVAGLGNNPIPPSSSPAGGGGGHNNMQPYFTLNYLIYAGPPASTT